MNRFVFGRGWVFEDEATDGTEGGAGGAGGDGAAAGDGGGEGEGAPAGGDGTGGDDGAAAAAAAAKKEEEPKDMKSAIDAALGYKTGDKQGERKPAAEKPAEKKPAAADGKETDTHHANGKPKKNEKGEALDADGKPVAKQAPKAKTAAELDMKPEQLKLLKPETQARFREVIGALKEREATIGTLTATNKTLAEARDAILGVMEDTKTSKEQLGAYLEFNALLQSSDPKDLEAALGMVEEQRTALYKALGREPDGGGIDLLADFPDLKKQVDEEEITRAAALEIAHGRRDRAAREAAATRQQQAKSGEQKTAEEKKKAGEDALKSIATWTAELSKSDLDYKAKEDKLLGETLTGVLNDYPPHLWLPTLKRLYAGIVVQKAPAAPSGHKPLRPSGAKPGSKQPTSMQEAIDQGLGYVVAEKG